MQSVYLDNTLGFHQGNDNNLKILTQQFDNGKRSLSTLSAILSSMGIPEEKVVYAIANYTKEGQAAYNEQGQGQGQGNPQGLGLGLGKGQGNQNGQDSSFMNKYKKNRQNMQFNLKNLAELLTGLKTAILGIKESNVDKINYSANASHSIVESILREVLDLETANTRINESKDDLERVALIKESLHPAVFVSKPEYFLLNKAFEQLQPYADLVAVKEYLEQSNFILKENFYTNYISNMIYEMLNLSEHAFYSDAVDDMKYLLQNDETYIKENITLMLNKHSWIPNVQGLLNVNAMSTKKLASSGSAIVERVFSPIHQNEDGTYIFKLDESFYQVNTDKTLQKVAIEDVNKLDDTFLTIATILKEYKVDENKITLYRYDQALELVFEDNKILINGVEKNINDFESVKDALLGSAFFRLDESHEVNDILLLVENISMVKELDIVDRIIGQNGNTVNIIKLSESSIYINRVNHSVLVNELFRANTAQQAQQIVNEYVDYDITNSVFDLLETDNKLRVVVNEKIKLHEDRVNFLNLELTKVVTANEELNNSKLNEAIKLLKSELRKEEIEVQKLYKEKSEFS